MSSGNPTPVLVYVQHLLGVGHLQRALQLSAALLERGFRVSLVSGGRPTALRLPAELSFHQLAPLYSADASFTRLLDADGKPIDDNWRERRKRALLAVFEAVAPQVLITETFPFGRRMLRFEVLPLLQASQGQCRLVIASIRDILQPRSNPERYRETCEWLADYYHRVLIHGDARIARLDDSFPHAAEIEAKLHYSGYICAANAPQPPGDDGRDEVLVSAGGSATGQRLLHSALAAKPLSIYRDARWRLLVSPAIADAQLDALRQSADNETIVERNRPDFSQLLRRARLSISQAGYNTVTDILSSDTPAIVVPFADADEVEQGMRAQALQARGRVLALDEASLDARSLAQVIARVDEIDTGLQAKLDGADDSASTIAQWLDDSRQAP